MPSFLGSSFLSSSIIKICICSLNTVLFGRLTCAFMYQYTISRVFHFHYWKPRVFISLLMPRISGSILHSRSPNPGDYVSISNLTNCTFLYLHTIILICWLILRPFLNVFTPFHQGFIIQSLGFFIFMKKKWKTSFFTTRYQYLVSQVLYFHLSL